MNSTFTAIYHKYFVSKRHVDTLEADSPGVTKQQEKPPAQRGIRDNEEDALTDEAKRCALLPRALHVDANTCLRLLAQ